MPEPVHPRLNSRTAADLAAFVRRPSYDRTATRMGVAHVGVGAFHRCHQAEYLEDLLEGGHDDQALTGINLRPPHLGEMLGRQDGLYMRSLTGAQKARDVRLIGCIRRVVDAADAPDAAVQVLADPAITTATLTVTEKGYCHRPATGALDEDHPDILADLSAPARAARSVPGFLVRGLAARAAAGGGPVNLISCDNISGNGQVLRAVVLSYCAVGHPALEGWIADNVAFPSTMVDRIVPAASEEALAGIARDTGVEDQAAVQGEPFRQWVIEDAFRAPRPRWEAAGAEIAADVTPHEQVKMRVLNAAQTMMALLGCLAGHEFSFQSERDPAIRSFVRQTVAAETLPHLPAVPGMEGPGYLARSLDRISNGAIRHLNQQIATDTSQKIRQRLLDPIRTARAAGARHDGLTCAVAAWVAYLAASVPAFGARWSVSDPVMDRLKPMLLARRSDIDGIVRDVVGLQDLFGGDLSRNDAFRAAVGRQTRRFLRSPVAEALSDMAIPWADRPSA